MKKVTVGCGLILLLVLLISCSAYYTEGDSWFIERKGAVMPVLVRGKIDSGTFVVWLHGGPGETSMAPELFPALLELEKKYAMVYWDQRASGMSQGSPPIETFTLNEFIADLDLLLDVIDTRYESPDIFMMGVSWGGTFGTAYLAEENNQQRVSGWIEIDGGHNMELMMELSVQWVKERAADRIASGQDTAFWRECLEWYAALPADVTEFSAGDHRTHSNYVRAGDGYRPATSTASSAPGFEEIFLSSFNFSAFLNSSRLIPNFDIRSLNLNDEMAGITIPVLLIWGVHDGMSPPAMMDNAADYLGTAPADLRTRLFAESGHNPFTDEPVKFAAEVIDFIDIY